MLRGGSWNNNDRNVRCSNRNRNNPDNRNNNNGFRVAVSLASIISLPRYVISTEITLAPEYSIGLFLRRL
ncbi:MAG: hypothetical protein ACOY90_10595 [Candidatus Zhuqueibacterota bacterium]